MEKEHDETTKELGEKIDKRMEKIKESQDQKKTAIIVLSIFVGFFALVIMGAYFVVKDRDVKLQALKSEHKALQEVSNRQEDIIKARFDYHDIKSELHTAKEKMKTLQDIDRVCIASYIKDRYSKTPTILAKAIADQIVELSRKHKVPVPLIVGIAETESAFNPYSKSTADARGIMQVRWKIWAEILKDKMNISKESDLHEVDKGIEAGIYVLKDYLQKAENNLKKALWAYNGKHADHDKYANKVFTNVGRYILHKCHTTYNMEDFTS